VVENTAQFTLCCCAQKQACDPAVYGGRDQVHFEPMDGRIRPTRTWHSGVVHVGVDVVVGVVLDGDGDGDVADVGYGPTRIERAVPLRAR